MLMSPGCWGGGGRERSLENRGAPSIATAGRRPGIQKYPLSSRGQTHGCVTGNPLSRRLRCRSWHLSRIVHRNRWGGRCRLPGFTGPNPSTSLDKVFTCWRERTGFLEALSSVGFGACSRPCSRMLLSKTGPGSSFKGATREKRLLVASLITRSGFRITAGQGGIVSTPPAMIRPAMSRRTAGAAASHPCPWLRNGSRVSAQPGCLRRCAAARADARA